MSVNQKCPQCDYVFKSWLWLRHHAIVEHKVKLIKSKKPTVYRYSSLVDLLNNPIRS